MKNYKSKFQAFKNEQLTKFEQKSVRGGDGEITPPTTPVDPGKVAGSGNP